MHVTDLVREILRRMHFRVREAVSVEVLGFSRTPTTGIRQDRGQGIVGAENRSKVLTSAASLNLVDPETHV